MKRLVTSAFGVGLLLCSVACSKKPTAEPPVPSPFVPLPTFGPVADYHPMYDPKNFSPNPDTYCRNDALPDGVGLGARTVPMTM